MKTLIKQIKILALATVLAFSMSSYAQKDEKMHKIFVRVYNLEGKKISNGSIILINDSLLGLKNSSDKVKISMKDIGIIKTKRSTGNNVLFGAVGGAVIGGILGASSADPNEGFIIYTSGDGALMGGFLGAVGGGGLGALTSLLKESETYIISGSEMNWKTFIKVIEEK